MIQKSHCTVSTVIYHYVSSMHCSMIIRQYVHSQIENAIGMFCDYNKHTGSHHVWQPNYILTKSRRAFIVICADSDLLHKDISFMMKASYRNDPATRSSGKGRLSRLLATSDPIHVGSWARQGLRSDISHWSSPGSWERSCSNFNSSQNDIFLIVPEKKDQLDLCVNTIWG